MFEIKNKETGEVLASFNADSLNGADLSELDLRDADLREQDLQNALFWHSRWKTGAYPAHYSYQTFVCFIDCNIG